MDWQNHMVAAQGFLELGMHQDAWDELEAFDPVDRTRPGVLIMRLAILQAMGKWEKGAEIAQGALTAFPELGELYLLGSYHIRRAQDTRSAFEFLEKGKRVLADEGCFWFNMGCYHCQLGRLTEAKACVRKAIKLDRSYQELALDDEDLEPLWDSWAVEWP